MRLLIIEDNKELADFMKTGLEKAMEHMYNKCNGDTIHYYTS